MNAPSRWGRTALAAGVVTTLAGTVLAAPASADNTYYVPVSKVWDVSGHGYGHGHGMSQYGAQGAALAGLKYSEIAEFYYPNTEWGAVKGKVRVLITADTTSDVQVKPRAGLKVTDLGDKSSYALPRGGGIDRWRLTKGKGNSTVVQSHDATGWHRWTADDGRKLFKGDGQFSAKGAITLLIPGGSDVVGKRYRGALRLASPFAGSTTRDTVNVLSMDEYVKGVVPYEMPASWHQQALRAQAVAARTYASYLRAQNPSRYYQVCDTTACQVYGGVAAEQDTSNNAVDATAGKILTYKNKAAFTQFSSSSGGWTSDGGQPYLPAKADKYDRFDGNAMHSWSTQINVNSIEAAHPEIGSLVDMRVTKRDGNGQWNGRVLQIRLNGTKGTAYMTGDDFRWMYGLRSTWFAIAPTPIIERWQELGGAKSTLGKPSSGEFKLDKGSAQEFAHGKIFWHRKVGANEVRGPVLKAYMEYGGPSSRIGWPVSGMEDPLEGGKKVRFQRGRIFFVPRTGANVIYGAPMDYWAKSGSTSSAFGYPTANTHKVAGGLRSKFEHGSITWDRSSDTITTRMY